VIVCRYSNISVVAHRGAHRLQSYYRSVPTTQVRPRPLPTSPPASTVQQPRARASSHHLHTIPQAHHAHRPQNPQQEAPHSHSIIASQRQSKHALRNTGRMSTQAGRPSRRESWTHKATIGFLHPHELRTAVREHTRPARPNFRVVRRAEGVRAAMNATKGRSSSSQHGTEVISRKRYNQTLYHLPCTSKPTPSHMGTHILNLPHNIPQLIRPLLLEDIRIPARYGSNVGSKGRIRPRWLDNAGG
jgi:hypothetical protein